MEHTWTLKLHTVPLMFGPLSIIVTGKKKVQTTFCFWGGAI